MCSMKLGARAQHAFAAVWDVGVLVGLLGYAADSAPLNQYRSKYWLHQTFDLGPRAWYETNTTSGRAFYVIEPSNAVPIDIIALASSYIVISGLHHAVVFLVWPVIARWDSARPTSQPQYLLMLQERSRWVDYIITPSLILVALSCLFGADNYVALVLAPLLLAVLLLLSAVWEPRPRSAPVTSYNPLILIAETGLSTLQLVVLIPPYLLTWVPVVYSTAISTTASEVSAPDFIWVFLAIIFLLFATFPVVYFINPMDRERYYMICSLASKTAAHWFVGITAVDQSNMIGTSADDVAADNNTRLWVGAAGGVGFPILLGLIARYGFEPPKQPDTDQTVQLLAKGLP